jgi:hypothetical protein
VAAHILLCYVGRRIVRLESTFEEWITVMNSPSDRAPQGLTSTFAAIDRAVMSVRRVMTSDMLAEGNTFRLRSSRQGR